MDAVDEVDEVVLVNLIGILLSESNGIVDGVLLYGIRKVASSC